MDNRDELIANILPEITGNLPTNNLNEEFQNEVLRPILKFQNDLLLIYFQQYIIEYKIEFNLLKHHLKILKINDLFKSNIQYKQLYLGLVIGLFTLKQSDYYLQNKKELNKRIIAMLIERISSQVEKVI